MARGDSRQLSPAGAWATARCILPSKPQAIIHEEHLTVESSFS